MTDPLLSLESTQLAVEPGGQVRVTVTVNNPGKLVEGYQLDVVGDGVSDWAEVVPPEVNVYPAEEATAVVVISPPAGGAAPSGGWPFGVRARSLVDPGSSVVVEGEVEVGKVFGLQAKLVPVTSSGRWRGRHVLHVSNWGNSSVKLTLVASDPDKALGYLVRPPVVDVPVGGQATARLWVRGRRPFLRGSPVRVPFSVVGEREGATASTSAVSTAGLTTADRPAVDGALNQKPILSRASVALGILALVLAVGGALWFIQRPPAEGSQNYRDGQAPEQPRNLRAVGTGPATVNVTWDALRGVKSWEVRLRLGAAAPVSRVQPVDAAQTSATIDGLPAASEVCFQVRALGFGLDGPPSEVECANTLQATPSATPSPLVTLPPPGQESTAAPPASPVPPAGAPGAGPSPSGSPTAPGTSPTATPPGESPTATPPGQSPTATPPGQSPTASPGGSPPGTGSGVPVLTGKWVAVTLAAASVDTTIPLIQDEVVRVRTSGVEPLLINSGDAVYAELSPPGRGPVTASWMVVIGPFDTELQAAQECLRVGSVPFYPCRALQPDPS